MIIIDKIIHKLIVTLNQIQNRKNKKLFLRQYEEFKKDDRRFESDENDLFPCLNDATENTNFDAHYTYHPAWAARIVRDINPPKHIDISSILHFSTMLSAFIPVEFYDFRPVDLNLSNLTLGAVNLNDLPFATNSIESLSCMHTLEHIGLGRYGDELNAEGDLKAIAELKRVVKIGGSLIIVTPIGKPKLQFNAHRIYSYEMIIEYFSDFLLKDFSLVNDSSQFISPANPNLVALQSYGCGCFWFIKK
jgi:SAM-dependent methyltransferase